jgi:ActR/RegA family two-component response regulator
MSVLADAKGNDVILCVDDDVVLVRLMQRLFSRRGYVVEHAADAVNGSEGETWGSRRGHP